MLPKIHTTVKNESILGSPTFTDHPPLGSASPWLDAAAAAAVNNCFLQWHKTKRQSHPNEVGIKPNNNNMSLLYVANNISFKCVTNIAPLYKRIQEHP